MEMSITLILLLFLFCTGASFVQRVSGFGFGIFIMTVLPYLLPSYGEATTLSGMLSLTQSLFIFATHYKYVNWKRLLPMLITFLVVSFFAVRFVAEAADTHLKLLLGIILIIMSLYFLFFNGKFKIKPTLKLEISLGTLSGAMGGLFGMQGPPAVVFYLASEKDKDHYLGMLQAYFLIGNAVMTLYRSRFGLLTESVAWGWVYAVAGIPLGGYIGKIVFDKLSGDTLRKIVYIYMAISGLVAIISELSV